MARSRKVADMTLAQKQARENDKFRQQAYVAALDEVAVAPVNDDINKFRRDSYRDALRDAKATRRSEPFIHGG